MKTLNTLKLKIMVRAFHIRIKNGEVFEDIAADYPAVQTYLTDNDVGLDIDADGYVSLKATEGNNNG